MIQRWKHRAVHFKHLVMAVYFACRDPRSPWAVSLLAASVAAYAFSPIDLIPDFIPVIGYLDDLVLIPLGVALVIRMLPENIWLDAQAAAAKRDSADKPRSWYAAALIVMLWLFLCVSGIRLVWNL